MWTRARRLRLCETIDANGSGVMSVSRAAINSLLNAWSSQLNSSADAIMMASGGQPALDMILALIF